MFMRILAVGTRMPDWVTEGYNEYAKRFPPGWTLELVEIPAEKRTKSSDFNRIIQIETEKIQNYTKTKKNRTIALDVKGQPWSTEQLAQNLKQWNTEGKHLDFIIGGPEGLSNEIIQQADNRWSLSPLTFPHPLVRIILAEQLYRAWSILQNHPYHR